jgi:hypothetical protein
MYGKVSRIKFLLYLSQKVSTNSDCQTFKQFMTQIKQFGILSRLTTFLFDWLWRGYGWLGWF